MIRTFGSLAFWFVPTMLFWVGGVACLYVLRGYTEIGIFPAIAPSRVAAKLREFAQWLVGIGVVIGFFVAVAGGVRYLVHQELVRDLLHSRIFEFLFSVAFLFSFMTVMPLWGLIWRWTDLEWTAKLGSPFVCLMGPSSHRFVSTPALTAAPVAGFFSQSSSAVSRRLGLPTMGPPV
jgi:hypothetical protein